MRALFLLALVAIAAPLFAGCVERGPHSYTECIKSHTERKWQYHYGYYLGKYQYHGEYHTEKVCDVYMRHEYDAVNGTWNNYTFNASR